MPRLDRPRSPTSRQIDLGPCGFLHAQPAVILIADVGLCVTHLARVRAIKADQHIPSTSLRCPQPARRSGKRDSPHA